MFIKILSILLGVYFSSLTLTSYSSTIQSSSCMKSLTDFDGDGIPNNWENNSIDINKDNIIDLNLTNISSLLHKDIFLELDYMENHKPNQSGIQNVINAFNNAPVCNPDGHEGITLHISIDDMIPHDENTVIDCAEGWNKLSYQENKGKVNDWTEIENIKKNYLGTKEERANKDYKYIFDARGSIYYYGVFIHQINDAPVSGCAHDKERLFVISLGNESWWQLDDVIGKDPITNDTKSNSDFQARSLMHELGHTLGLVHGGNRSLNDLNYKPNYLSIMNYLYLFPDSRMENASFLDYSRCALPDINEVMTNYSKGVEIGNCNDFINKKWIWVGHHDYNNNTAACLPDTMVQFNHPVNWSKNRIKDSIFTDINCDGRASDVLRGFDDWENLEYLRK